MPLDFVHVHLHIYIGTSSVIRANPALSSQLDDGEEVTQKPTCNKDTGGKRTLQWWTRGHFFIVRGGGHIDAWQPLYQFDLQPQHLPDYEVSNWYVSTYPKSLFVNSLIAAKPDTDCRYALHDNHFAIHHLSGKTERHVLTTVKELCAVLANEFRLTLPDHQDLENTLHRLIQPDASGY